MDIEVINSATRFDELQEPWNRLAERANARPFQDFGWASAWIHSIGATGGRRLHIVTLWRAGELLAVLPMTVRRYKGVRVLEWVGVHTIDYCDALVDPSIDGEAALRQLWAAVIRKKGFDVARFGQVRVDASINPLLTSQTPWVETIEESQGVQLAWSSGEEWLQQRGSSMRDSIRYRLRRMSKMGFEFRIWQPSEPYEALLEAMMAQKSAWLAAKGVSGFLTEPGGPEFLRSLVKSMANSGTVHLSVIQSPEGIAAGHLGFLRDGVFYYYMPTYDARWAKFSFGTALLDSLLMWSCDQRLKRFDMLLGDNDYKLRYDVTPESVRTLVLPRNLLGRAAVAYYRFKKAPDQNIVPATLPGH